MILIMELAHLEEHFSVMLKIVFLKNCLKVILNKGSQVKIDCGKWRFCC